MILSIFMDGMSSYTISGATIMMQRVVRKYEVVSQILLSAGDTEQVNAVICGSLFMHHKCCCWELSEISKR